MKDIDRPLIVLLASAETSPAVLYGLYDVLSSVGSSFMEMITGVPGEDIMDVMIVAASSEPFRCFGNVSVDPHASIDDIENPDAVIVCDMYTPINESPRGTYPREIEWLKKVYANNALLTSVCSGSAVLAETGLLDGLEVSGHWAYRHMFRKFYPKLKWQEASVLNLSAEHKRIITTGGVTAWQDLAIYLITRFCGVQHAIDTARLHLLSTHTEGQLPFAAMTQNQQHDDAVISDCQDWIADHYHCTNPVARMTERAGLQARTFARRFSAATGYHPLDYVQELRIEIAKKLLATEATNVDEISVTVGYEDPTSFRRLFKRKAGLTPAVYRKKFAGIVDTKSS
jgi:transcriptional regulator GlxA family with amidase domain